MFRTDKDPKLDKRTSESLYPPQPEPIARQRIDPAESNPPAAGPPAGHDPRRAVSDSEWLAREIKEGRLNGYFGSNAVLTGDVVFNGMLRVDGRLSGSISSVEGSLIVGAGGEIHANIDVAVAQIHGRVEGDTLASSKIELGRTAKVIGNVSSPSLRIEQGAIFEGRCSMSGITKGGEGSPPAGTQEKPPAAIDQRPNQSTEAKSETAAAAGPQNRQPLDNKPLDNKSVANKPHDRVSQREETTNRDYQRKAARARLNDRPPGGPA
jgi:cytoskeletal protein CcmA (bactofilin family)